MNEFPADTNESGNVSEIQFALHDSSYPCVNLSAELDCRLNILETVRSCDEQPRTSMFLDVADDCSAVDVSAVKTCDRTTDVRRLDASDGGCLLEVVVTDSVLAAVANAGAILSSGHAESGEFRFTVFLPPGRDPERTVEAVTEDHPALSISAITERPVAEPFLTQQGFQTLLHERLTDRQWQTLRLAHTGGYFERPREIPQSDIADAMDISQETVSQHLRAAQRRLLAIVFESGLFDAPNG